MLVFLVVALAGCSKDKGEATQTVAPVAETKNPEATEEVKDPEVTPIEQEETKAPEETAKATQEPEEKVSSSEKKKVQAMEPIFDSLIRATIETGSKYAPRDNEYFWYTLYLIGVNYGGNNPLVEKEEFEYRVPRKLMQEYASASFLDYDDLLEFPEEFSVQYSEDYDAYILPLSDKGDDHIEIKKIVKKGKERMVTVVTKEQKEVTGSYQFTIVDNPYASGITDPEFYYTVKDLIKIK